MYRLIFTPRAKKRLKEISKKNHQIAVALVIEDIKEDPYIGKILKRELNNRFVYRVGVYRIIYKIYEKEKKIEVISVGHRSVVYN